MELKVQKGWDYNFLGERFKYSCLVLAANDGTEVARIDLKKVQEGLNFINEKA